jgi:hypothetical protein
MSTTRLLMIALIAAALPFAACKKKPEVPLRHPCHAWNGRC